MWIANKSQATEGWCTIATITRPNYTWVAGIVQDSQGKSFFSDGNRGFRRLNSFMAASRKQNLHRSAVFTVLSVLSNFLGKLVKKAKKGLPVACFYRSVSKFFCSYLVNCELKSVLNDLYEQTWCINCLTRVKNFLNGWSAWKNPLCKNYCVILRRK